MQSKAQTQAPAAKIKYADMQDWMKMIKTGQLSAVNLEKKLAPLPDKEKTITLEVFLRLGKQVESGPRASGRHYLISSPYAEATAYFLRNVANDVVRIAKSPKNLTSKSLYHLPQRIPPLYISIRRQREEPVVGRLWLENGRLHVEGIHPASKELFFTDLLRVLEVKGH